MTKTPAQSTGKEALAGAVALKKQGQGQNANSLNDSKHSKKQSYPSSSRYVGCESTAKDKQATAECED